ncbi:transmembrane protein 191C isoform X2 [Monodelphis domestica]|uniref:transmembrane protein 191C isoform X2 n=1 Tax=Monodelphis domestica TaxID=13616 RepID=UPI0024E21547|nr:transmembrane protein 191C isoform X2 [Monodelphis domestica]
MAEVEEILLQLQKDNRDGRLRKQELEELMRILETESDSLVLTLRSLRERERSLQRRLNQAAGALRGEAEDVVKTRAAHTLELIAVATEQKLILERSNQLLQEEWEELSSQLFYYGGEQQCQRRQHRRLQAELLGLQKQLELMESKSALQAEGILKGVLQKEEAWASFQEQSGVLQELQTKVMEVASMLDLPREGAEPKPGQFSSLTTAPGSLMEEVAEASFENRLSCTGHLSRLRLVAVLGLRLLLPLWVLGIPLFYLNLINPNAIRDALPRLCSQGTFRRLRYTLSPLLELQTNSLLPT